MSQQLARRAGSAVVWRSIALAGEKLIFLIRLVILARILVPEDFGLVAIGMAAMVLMVSLTDLGVVAALVQQPSTEKKHLDTAWTISVLRGLMVAAALFLAAPQIAAGFGEPAAKPFIQVIGVTVLLRSAASIRIAQLNRELHFRSLAVIGLATAVVNTAVAVALAPGTGPWSLIWGNIAGSVTFLVGSFLAAPYLPRLRFFRGSADAIMRFGRWIFLIGIIAVLSDTILRLIITRKLGVAELGLFFMAARLGFLPAQLISEIVGTVAFPVYARLQYDREKATNMYRRVLVATTALMVPACAIFACLVPSLVSDLLGDRWQGTVLVMQLLILSSVVGILGDTVAPLLKGIGQPARIAWMDSWQLLVLVFSAWMLVDTFGLAGAGVAWVISVGATQFFAFAYAGQQLNSPFRDLSRVLLSILLSALLAAAVAIGVVSGLSGLPGILLAGGCSALATILVLVILDGRFHLGLRETLVEPFPWMRRFAGFRRRFH